MSMKSSLLVCLLLLAAFSCAWSKAVESGAGEKEKNGDKLEPAKDLEISSPEILDSSPDKLSNPCVYKGNIFTIDVRKIANRFK